MPPLASSAEYTCTACGKVLPQGKFPAWLLRGEGAPALCSADAGPEPAPTPSP